MMAAARPDAGERMKPGPWRRAVTGIFLEMGAAALYLLVLLGLCVVVSQF